MHSYPAYHIKRNCIASCAYMQYIVHNYPEERTMRDYGEYARNAVRVWLRQVMEEKNWSANEWGLMAKTSPTNITRMLSPTAKSVPSVDTICKLAMVAGSQPNLLPGRPAEQSAPCNYCPDCGYDLRRVTQPPLPKRKAS